MKIIIPSDWEIIDLEKESDPNKFGEALRNYCFVGNCMQIGCYDTSKLIPQLKKVESGKVFEEAKKQICPEFKLKNVYHYIVKEKDCLLNYNDPEGKKCTTKIGEPMEIICAWEWNGDGTLYFRFNNRAVINTDCKKDYVWEWVD